MLLALPADTPSDVSARIFLCSRVASQEELAREMEHMTIRLGDGFEFRIGEGESGGRAALPKGTKRT